MYQTIWHTIQVPRDSTEAVPVTYSAWRVATRLDSRGITSFGLSTEDFYPTLSLTKVRWKPFSPWVWTVSLSTLASKILAMSVAVSMSFCASASSGCRSKTSHLSLLQFFSLLSVTVTKQPPVRPSLPLFFPLKRELGRWLLFVAEVLWRLTESLSRMSSSSKDVYALKLTIHSSSHWLNSNFSLTRLSNSSVPLNLFHIIKAFHIGNMRSFVICKCRMDNFKLLFNEFPILLVE